MANADSKRGARFVDLTGQRFGRLVALQTEGKYAAGFKWRLRCDCGVEIVAIGSNVRAGRTRSCGCLRDEAIVSANTTHGKRYTPEFKVWAGMHNRCRNPNDVAFTRYGGRGIRVCERWRDFESFYADMGARPSHKHSLDRINNDGNYAPDNCRWATASQQRRNQRGTIYLEFNGRRLAMADVAELLGVTYSTMENRLRRGDTGERLFRPTRTRMGRLNGHSATHPTNAPSVPPNT